MAYVSKENKTAIVAAVKAVLPKGWKVTFKVRHYSTIVCTVRSAPVSLDIFPRHNTDWQFLSINPYQADRASSDPAVNAILAKIVAALNTDNYDNSDIMTDYFDVGHYVDLRFGEHDKPFIDSRTIIKPSKADAKKLIKDLF